MKVSRRGEESFLGSIYTLEGKTENQDVQRVGGGAMDWKGCGVGQRVSY